MKKAVEFCFCRALISGAALATCCLGGLRAGANPAGATVSQGTASFSSQGSQLTVKTSDLAYINWQSFNIGQGQTTSFVQPSSSSLVWNQINDPNPSQILGNLNANGYVVLQNQSGFYVGGQASITAHGLIMTTAPIAMPDLSSSGPWDFNTPPPAAKIINYGQIQLDKGGSVFLIANDIENSGTISAPAGSIGLYAGKQVLVSDRADGRGLSATVTLPQGSVDNSGKLIADAGTIAVNAQVVNQGGLIQANSIQEQNGVIELTAGNSLNLGPASVISAKGDTQGTSPGGNVTLQSGNTYQDSPTSTIDVSGGAQGGNGGQVEVSAPSMSAINSTINGSAAPGSVGGRLTIDPDNIILDTSGTDSAGTGIVTGGTGTLDLNVDSAFTGFSQISLQANQNITLESGTIWDLANSTGISAPGSQLTLQAGNNIELQGGAAILADQNWNVTMVAGTSFVPSVAQPVPPSGSDGIYLDDTASIQGQNGTINLSAANEVQVGWEGIGNQNTGTGSITTVGGGNIQVTTQFGDVNTGANNAGYTFSANLSANGTYYTVSSAENGLGGISTGAGGNLTINAGGNVRSYLPTSQNDNGQDAGSGAFGPEPGNVTINAGGSVFGHYVLANGIGTITAQDNVGGPTLGDYVSLSLVAGGWTLNAPNGNIYLQEVRNPNGIYNNHSTGARSHAFNPLHFFDYSPQASLTLNAGNGVEFVDSTGNLPRAVGAVPVLLPPSLIINAGPGGVLLDDDVTLFPSPDGELEINTTGGGSLSGAANTGNTVNLLMSDSGSQSFLNQSSFGVLDHGSVPLELNNFNPVVFNISGNVENISIITVKETQMIVDGSVINSSFSGQNLHPTDNTFIHVTGTIFNSPSFSSVVLPQAPTQVAQQDLPPDVNALFDTLVKLAVDPVALAALNVSQDNPVQLLSDWGSLLVTPNNATFTQPSGFAYDSTTGTLSFLGQMNQRLLNLFSQPTITVVRFGNNGLPLVDSTGHFETDTYTWVNTAALNTLIAESATTATVVNNGLRIGGPGQFDITAGSIQLGNSSGILSVGALDYSGDGLGNRYANLASITPVGANIDVETQGNIDLVTSTIASLAGGNVTVRSDDGEIDLGSADALFSNRTLPLGAFVTGSGPLGPGDIDVSAYGDVNIDSSRVAAYDGGSVAVSSDTGDVNAGSGGATAALVETHFVNPVTGLPGSYIDGVYGNGILATTLVNPSQVPGAPVKPGNITVTTPEGNIVANLGGILQEALNGDISSGPTITLSAGSPGFIGNVDLGDSGVIGGTVNITATGDINGLIISRQNSDIQAAQNFNGTVLSGGSATLAAGGTATGTVVGVGGVSASGSSTSGLVALGQSVSVNGGATTSTLGTSASATAASSSAAGTASTDAKDTTGADGDQSDDDLKKKGKGPLLAKRVGRVTVILPRG